MRKEPREIEYQGLIVDHMTEHPRSAVWAGMGAGKTLSSLLYLDRLQLQGIDGPYLVLAPLLVAKTSWVTEASKWEPLR